MSLSQKFNTQCVTARLVAAVIATIAIEYAESDTVDGVFAGLAIIVAIGFAVQIYRTAVGTVTTGYFGGEIWWKWARYIHVILFATTAVLILTKFRFAALLLFADVIIGIVFKIVLIGI